MFASIKPEIPGSPIFRDSDWISPDRSLIEAFLETKPLHGWYYHPLELPILSKQELNSIARIDSCALTKLVLWQFDWGINPEVLNNLIDTIYNLQTCQSKYPNDWESHIATTRNISIEFLSWLFEYVKDFPIKEKLISFHHLPSFINIRRRHTHIGVLSHTIQGICRILQGSQDIQSILLVPCWDTPSIQKIHPISTPIFTNTHLVHVDIPPQATQDIIRQFYESKERLFKLKFGVISFDSTNIADILAQTVMPFQFYSELVKNNKIKNGDEIILWVSSENYSEVLACIYAKKMWLPIKYVYITASKNDPIWEFLKTGMYDSKGLWNSFSECIALQEPIRSVNFARILLHLTKNDYSFVSGLFNEKSKNLINLSRRRLSQIRETLILWENMDQEGLKNSNPDIVDQMMLLSNWDRWNTDNQIPFFVLNPHHTSYSDLQQDKYLSYTDISNNVDRAGNENKNPLEILNLNQLNPNNRREIVKWWIEKVLENK